MGYEKETGRIHYMAGDVPVLIRHVANVANLQYRDQPGLGWLKNEMTGEDFSTNQHTRQQVVQNDRAKRIIPAHNLWLTTRTPVEKHHFLTVIYPVQPGEKPPDIKRLDDWTVRIRDGATEDVISFDPEVNDTEHPATIRIDLPAFRQPLDISGPSQGEEVAR